MTVGSIRVSKNDAFSRAILAVAKSSSIEFSYVGELSCSWRYNDSLNILNFRYFEYMGTRTLNLSINGGKEMKIVSGFLGFDFRFPNLKDLRKILKRKKNGFDEYEMKRINGMISQFVESVLGDETQEKFRIK